MDTLFYLQYTYEQISHLNYAGDVRGSYGGTYYRPKLR